MSDHNDIEASDIRTLTHRAAFYVWNKRLPIAGTMVKRAASLSKGRRTSIGRNVLTIGTAQSNCNKQLRKYKRTWSSFYENIFSLPVAVRLYKVLAKHHLDLLSVEDLNDILFYLLPTFELNNICKR